MTKNLWDLDALWVRCFVHSQSNQAFRTHASANQTKHFVHSQSKQAFRTQPIKTSITQPIKTSISYTANQNKRIFPKTQATSFIPQRSFYLCNRPHWKRALLATASASDIILHLVGHSLISFHASDEHIRSFGAIQPCVRHLPSLAPRSVQLLRSAALKRGATRSWQQFTKFLVFTRRRDLLFLLSELPCKRSWCERPFRSSTQETTHTQTLLRCYRTQTTITIEAEFLYSGWGMRSGLRHPQERATIIIVQFAV